MPLIPDADIGTEDLAAEGRGAGGYVQGLVTVKCHGQVRVDGTFGHLACVGVDAAGQVNCQHKCAVFPLAVYQCAGGQPGRAQTAVEPGTVQGVYHGVKGLCRQGRSVTVSRSMRMRSPTSRCIWAVRWKRRRNWQTVCLPCCTAPATTIWTAAWQDRIGAAITGEHWLDFTAAGKDKGLHLLCAHFGIPQENTYAFGDSYNDTPMLRAAAHPYLMNIAPADLKEEFATQIDDVAGVLKTLGH